MISEIILRNVDAVSWLIGTPLLTAYSPIILEILLLLAQNIKIDFKRLF